MREHGHPAPHLLRLGSGLTAQGRPDVVEGSLGVDL